MSHTVYSRMRAPDDPDTLRQLIDELANFEDIAKSLIPQPGDLPRLQGIDVGCRARMMTSQSGSSFFQPMA